MRSEEQNQGRAFLSEPKGSLYFVRNGAYLIATQEKESTHYPDKPKKG